MKMKSKFIILILGMALLAATTGYGQELVLELKEGSVERWALSNVISLKYESDGLLIIDLEENSSYWALRDIERYYFTETTSVTDKAIPFSVRLSPNPTRQGVRVEIYGAQPGEMIIEVLDGYGKKLEELYRGMHAGGHAEVYWRGKEAGTLAAGVYYCRISLGAKVLTRSIVVL